MRDPRLLVRIASGLIFVGFGAAKFLNHGVEVDSFETYGLPSPDIFVYAIGAIELTGGLMLLFGRAVCSTQPFHIGRIKGVKLQATTSGTRKWETV